MERESTQVPAGPGLVGARMVTCEYCMKTDGESMRVPAGSGLVHVVYIGNLARWKYQYHASLIDSSSQRRMHRNSLSIDAS